MKRNDKAGGGERPPKSLKLKMCALLAILALLTIGIVFATDGSEESSAAMTVTYAYNTTAKTATVSGGTGEGILEIPAMVSNPSDMTTPYTVVGVADDAFRENRNMTKLHIAGSLTSIGFTAFYGCTGLTSVTMSGTVTTFESDVFHGCTSLKDVDLGPVTTVGESMFQRCTNLTTVSSISVRTIGFTAFYGCTSLTTIDLDSVTSIEGGAFGDCTSLTTVDFVSDAFIGSGVFDGCTSLATVSLGPVTTIGSYMFNGCTGLTSLDFGLTGTIGEYAFRGCTGLTSVTIPRSVTTLEVGAFSGCINLTSVIMECSATIPSGLFFECTNLVTVDLGFTTGFVGDGAFTGCPSLTSLSMPSSINSWGRGTFEGCKNLKILAIPSGIDIADLIDVGYTGNFVSFSGVEKATAYSADGISVTVKISTLKRLVSLIDVAGDDVPFTGNSPWEFKILTGKQVIMTFDVIDYQGIYGVDDLKKIGNDPAWTLSMGYILHNDITFEVGDGLFTPIGTYSNPFVGLMDGNGFTIWNIDIDTVSSNGPAGLFGYVGSNARVFNLNMDGGSVVAGEQLAGGIVGVILPGGSVTISDCHSGNDVSSGYGSGGIVGYAGSGTVIEYCTSSSKISASSMSIMTFAGGIAGYLEGASVSDSSSSSQVLARAATAANAGGITGYAINSTISDSTNSGAVKGDSAFRAGSTTYAGGIAGRLDSSSLVGCSNGATGTIGIATEVNPGASSSFKFWLGGLVGDMTQGSSVEGCFNAAAVGANVPMGTTHLYVGGLVGAMYQGTSATDCISSGRVSGTNEAIPDLFVYAGGIAGAATGTAASPVSMVNCDVVGTASAVVANAANARAGGIVGYGLYAEASRCDSAGAVTGSGGSVAHGISGASVRSGGIAGYLEHSTVSACTASGAVSAVTLNANGLPKAGGIVGSMVMGTALTGCSATGAVVASSGIQSSGKAYAGGIAGYIEGASVSDSSSSSQVLARAATAANAGGITGYAINSTISDSTNSGAVNGDSTFHAGSTTYVGGIAGRLVSSSLVGCSNGATGTVGIATEVNPGASSSFRFWLGGLVGDMTQGSSVEGCSNAAAVGTKIPAGTTHLYVGGLVGAMHQGTSATDCTSSGRVSGTNEAVPDLFVYAGGIAGAAIGTAASPVSMVNCDVVGTASAVVANVANARVGGIVGYGLYAEASRCDSAGAVTGLGGSVAHGISGASVRSGGIAGYLEHSTVSACTASGAVSAVTLNANGLPRAGGIVGSMVMGTALTGCSATGAVVASSGIQSSGKAYAGGIAGLTEGTIEDCTYGWMFAPGSVRSVGFSSGAGGLAGSVAAGSVSGSTFAVVISEYTAGSGSGRAGSGAGFVHSSATVGSIVSGGTKATTPVPFA